MARRFFTVRSRCASRGTDASRDVSPREGQLFPLTKFVPWAAYARLRDGRRFLLEQDALFDVLSAQSAENADRISYDTAIDAMAAVESIELPAV